MASTNVLSTTPSYPIGSVFITSINTNPSELLGYGTWELIGSNRMIMGCSTDDDTGKATGGSNSKTIAVANLPSHTHTGPSHSHTIGNAGGHTHTTGGGACTAAANGAHSHVVNGGGHTSGAGGDHSHVIANGVTAPLESGGHQHTIRFSRIGANGTGRAIVDSSGGSYSGNATDTRGNHTHTIAPHSHTCGSSNNHTHAVANHTHACGTYAAHAHSVPAHAHSVSTVNDHSHTCAASGTGATGATGSGAALDVTNAYIKLYIWERTE